MVLDLGLVFFGLVFRRFRAWELVMLFAWLIKIAFGLVKLLGSVTVLNKNQPERVPLYFLLFIFEMIIWPLAGR
jgi:hypothetical protein